MSLAEKQQQLIDDLSMLDDPQERLGAVVDRAKRAPPLSAAERADSNRVRGCVSVVWVTSGLRDGRCYFRGDAESPVVRGLLVLLCDFFSGATPAEIRASPVDPLEALGLMRHLSPTRRNGLGSALAVIRAFAENPPA